MRGAVAAVALATAVPAAAQAPDPYAAGRAIVADFQRIVSPAGVQETFEATLGGTRQVVNVRGADRTNPLLVFIHGGPASPELPLAWTFQRAWEDHFTVVQWDQRGSGRSFPLNDPAALAPTLTPERYRDDTIELIEQLRARYGKRKVVLMGLSWGSAVGVMVAARRPDLLHAYVGMGQLIDFRQNERVGYAWTLAEARRRGNAEAVRALEAIAPYPGDGPVDVAKTAVERDWNVKFGGLAAYRDNGDFYFRTGRLSPDYTAADRKAWDAGSEYTMTRLWPRLASLDLTTVRRIRVPVILFLGRKDYTTPSDIAARWLARLSAPRKKIVWFDRSAHLPLIEEPGRTVVELVTQVRPFAKE